MKRDKRINGPAAQRVKSHQVPGKTPAAPAGHATAVASGAKERSSGKSGIASLLSRVGLRGWLCCALAVIATVTLAAGCPEYLRRMEALSLMVTAPLFTADYWATPGGPLELAARWLTQFFYHPWAGAAIYGALLGAIQWFGCRAFGLRRWWQLAFIIIPLWMMWMMLSMGYLIFNTKTPAFAMQTALGVALAMVAACYVPRKSSLWSAVWYAALALAGFYLMGFYGLLAVLCCIACRWRQWISVVVGACAVAAAPWAISAITTGTMHVGNAYVAGLPKIPKAPGADDEDMTGREVPAWRRWIAPSPVALTDDNFRLTLALQRAIDEGRWAQAADMAMQQDVEPTRINVFLGSIAMMRAGVAPDRMFAQQIGAADYNTPVSQSVLHDVGAIPMWYNIGETNLAYRWAMEYSVERGFSVETLKYLVKCALLNGDYHLADKYLDVLSTTMHHRRWAEHYRRYVSDPSRMSEEPELAALMPLQSLDNFLASDNGSLEAFIWPLLQQQPLHTPQKLELSMLADLMMKDLPRFMSKAPAYMETHQRLPWHFQEAILLWSGQQGTKDYERYPIDQGLKSRFAAFVKQKNKVKTNDPEVLQDALSAYKGTYWHYFAAIPIKMK